MVLVSPISGKKVRQEAEGSNGISMASKTMSMVVDAALGAYSV